MTKYTPGPWEFETVGIWNDGVLVNESRAVCHISGYPICWIQDRKNEERTLANANLIAAAPDLLEVLQVIFNRVMYESPMAEIGDIFDNDMIERVKDVLSKTKVTP